MESCSPRRMAIKSQSKAEDCAGSRGRGSGEMQHFSHYHRSRANQGRDCVELGSQHVGYFHYEDVAHHAAIDSCQHD